MMTLDRFNEWLHVYYIEINDIQFTQFLKYHQLLVEWNEKINLTGITETEQVFLKHFYDSISLAFFVDMDKIASIADIGSGAGFPGLPLKILFPHLHITIIDSLAKRINFLRTVVDELQLSNVYLVHARAEDAARSEHYRDQFDLVTARAVARLNVLNELCMPFVKVGGTFAAMKGLDPQEEIVEAERSAKELNSEFVSISRHELPVERSERHIIVYRKNNLTPPVYPRKAGIPTKNPLSSSH